MLNEDVCCVEYKRYYKTKNGKYPMLSFCLGDPFLEEKLKVYGNDIDSATYVEFLKGNIFDKKMLKIPYQTVIIDITEYVVEYYVVYRNSTEVNFQNDLLNGATSFDLNRRIVAKETLFPSSHAMFKWLGTYSFYHCYGVSVPHDNNIESFVFRANSSIFPSGIRKSEYQLVTLLHYPNQMLTSSRTMKFTWPKKRVIDANYLMRFRINRVEIIRRRQKIHSPCNDNWENHDNWLKENHIKFTGCVPPYINTTSNVSRCSTQEQMRNSVFHLKTDGYETSPPCTSMENINYEYEEITLDTESPYYQKGVFYIGFQLFPEEYKEISQIR